MLSNPKHIQFVHRSKLQLAEMMIVDLFSYQVAVNIEVRGSMKEKYMDCDRFNLCSSFLSSICYSYCHDFSFLSSFSLLFFCFIFIFSFPFRFFRFKCFIHFLLYSMSPLIFVPNGYFFLSFYFCWKIFFHFPFIFYLYFHNYGWTRFSFIREISKIIHKNILNVN